MWKCNSVCALLLKVCRGKTDLEHRQRLKLSFATKGACESPQVNPTAPWQQMCILIFWCKPPHPPPPMPFYAQAVPRVQVFGIRSNVFINTQWKVIRGLFVPVRPEDTLRFLAMSLNVFECRNQSETRAFARVKLTRAWGIWCQSTGTRRDSAFGGVCAWSL